MHTGRVPQEQSELRYCCYQCEKFRTRPTETSGYD